MIRILSFIGLLFSLKFLPFFIFVSLALLYVYRWQDTYELIILGILADAFYGPVNNIPYYTLATGVTVLILEWLKPQLLFYNKQ